MNKKILFIGISLVLIGVFWMAMMFYQSQQGVGKTAEHQDNIVRVGAPMKGNPDAKVTIVEFLDPACETCRVFYPIVNQLVKKYPDKLKVVIRYAPLHKDSDKVVRLLEAAHLQGKFWPALELLFDKQRQWTHHHVAQPQIAKDLISTLDIDQNRLIQDSYGKKVTDALNADLTDGKKLKVKATPEFFVNGRQMPTFGYKQLMKLIEEEMAKNY